jgi:GrpB-like predicted nucleotidyltransferase (UPF0157 family)
MRAELEKLRMHLENLESADLALTQQHLADVARECEQPVPDKHIIGQALEQALEEAKVTHAFSDLLDTVEPLVERVVAWLGEDWRHIHNVLRSKELGKKYPIVMEAYNPQWERRCQEEAQFLLAQFGPDIILRTEHFGSTAVPGLAAKPVIDIMVEIPSFEVAEQTIVPQLDAQEYRYFWISNSRPGHMMFIKGYGPDGYQEGVQCYHLHMAPGDHTLWDRLLFRDYLRKYPETARRYAELKARLAERYRHDREAYTNGKTEFVTQVMKKARREVAV